MLDIIIPVYNNPLGLIKTLMSIGVDPLPIQVTIVDDGSTEDYSPTIGLFSSFMQIRLLRLEENHGPGYARQYGLLHTKEPYILFFDCGDIFYNPLALKQVIQTLQANPDKFFYEWHHIYEYWKDTFKNILNDTFHGKVYARKFFTSYHLNLPHVDSYMNEDIAFNKIARLFVPDGKYLQVEEPLLIRLYDENSLTAKDQHHGYYAGGVSLVKNIEPMFEQAKNGAIIFTEIVFVVMVHLYILSLEIQIRERDCLEEHMKYASYYYNHWFIKYYNDESEKLFNEVYARMISEAFEEKSPITEEPIEININKFFEQLTSY